MQRYRSFPFDKKMFCAQITFFLLFLVMNSSYPAPMLNIQDPAIVHTVYGSDKFYKKI